MSATVIAAVICVALTNVVTRELPLNVTAAPDRKPVPLTVSVKAAPPTVALVGESEVIVGTGLFTAKGEFADVPPPGAGLVTVTFKVPADAISAAAIDAVNCVALTNVVVLGLPLKFTTEVETKFVPFTVSVKVAPPFTALAGESDVMVGTGLFTANGELAERPPPGAGFVTVTLNVPAAAMSAAVIDAVTFVALTKVVVLAVPLKFTTEEATKLVPFTVRVKAAPPADALVGESEEIVGTGLLTANAELADTPPPGAGFVTVTLNDPAVAISVAVIAAVNWEALTKVVVAAVPLKFTTDDELKFEPFTVSVNVLPPAKAFVGDSEVIVGTGLFTVNEEIAEVPPPGTGFVTVTLSVPAVAISATVIVAVSCVAFTNVVVLGELLKFTTEPATKPVPFTVNEKAGPPAVALVGESAVMAGAGLLTANVELAEVPPPGVGLVTVTGKLPTAVMSAGEIAAVSCVALTNVVVLAAPLKFTTELETKPVPFTVNVKPAPPTVALVGEIVVIAGAGLLIVNV
jgi:hypothetical protein